MLHVLRAQQKAKGHGDSEQCFSMSSRLAGSVTVRSCNIRASFFTEVSAWPLPLHPVIGSSFPRQCLTTWCNLRDTGQTQHDFSVLSFKTTTAFVRHLKTEVKLCFSFIFILQPSPLLIHFNGFGLGASVVPFRKIMIQSRYQICINLHLIFVFSCLFVLIFSFFLTTIFISVCQSQL